MYTIYIEEIECKSVLYKKKKNVFKKTVRSSCPNGVTQTMTDTYRHPKNININEKKYMKYRI